MRVLCSCSYDGTNFSGFQDQPNLRTVQGEIEAALAQIHKKRIRIYAASRTDSKVHALDQYFHFNTDLEIPPRNLQKAINSRLPEDIYIKSVQVVEKDFNCRYNSTKKEYHYLVDLGPYNPLYRNYRYYYPYAAKLDIDTVVAASKVLIGKHDFKSFSKNKIIQDTVRTIYSIDFELKDNLLTIKFIGNGFLHNMVRILVAMLLSTGRGKYTIEDLKYILDAKKRQLAPEIAPACGLYLYKTYY